MNVHPFDRIEDITYVLDAEGRFTFVNTFALNVWQKQLHELLGLTLEEAPLPPSTRVIQDTLLTALHTQQRTEFETFGLRHQAWVNVTVYPDDGGLIVQVKRLLRHAGATTLIDHDALTGCLTRAAFLNILPTLSLPYVLAIVDLNLLKSVNTLRGHSGGDAHIRTVAHALREALPTESLICRWGGDEFVILTPGDDPAALQALLDETNASLQGPQPDVLAFTVGVTFREHDTPFERAFAIADEQLQLQKEQLRQTTSADHEATDLITFSQELEALNNPSDLIQHALNRLLNLLDFDQAAYAAIENNKTYYSHQALREGVLEGNPALYDRVHLSRSGFVQQVYHTRVTAWGTDYPNTPGRSQLMVDQGVKSAIVTPVISQGQVIAAITLRTVNRWQTITPHMRRIIELTALRLEHALELRRAVNAVRSTLEAGLLTLGIILEAKDYETHGHTHRAALMAERLGKGLGMTDSSLSHLRQGAYLHDLGKLCIPEQILKKPGKLSPEEWNVMQSHVLQGHDLATRIAGLSQETLNVIRSHHEHWDGSGYPDGLAGNDIPLEARIFAVCDVYDALISARPYKDAWTREKAIWEIEQQSGRHFDPDVIRAFLTLMDEADAPPTVQVGVVKAMPNIIPNP